MNNQIHKNFVFLSDVDPTIVENIRYHGGQNFLGRPVAGYKLNRTVCTSQAAKQLKKAHNDFKKLGYKIVLYDGYRSTISTDDFIK